MSAVEQISDIEQDAAEQEAEAERRFAKARLIADELLRASAECDRALAAAVDALRRREEARVLLARTITMPPDLLNRLAPGGPVERAVRHSGLAAFLGNYLTRSNGALKHDTLAQADGATLDLV